MNQKNSLGPYNIISKWHTIIKKWLLIRNLALLTDLNKIIWNLFNDICSSEVTMDFYKGLFSNETRDFFSVKISEWKRLKMGLDFIYTYITCGKGYRCCGFKNSIIKCKNYRCKHKWHPAYNKKYEFNIPAFNSTEHFHKRLKCIVTDRSIDTLDDYSKVVNVYVVINYFKSDKLGNVINDCQY